MNCGVLGRHLVGTTRVPPKRQPQLNGEIHL